MAEAGLLAMMVPAEYGGVGSPIADCAIALEEIARPSVDFATRLALIGWGAMILADLGAGQFATLTLDDGENKPTTRNRLKAAAERRNLTIAFRRTKDNTIVFSLGEPEVGP